MPERDMVVDPYTGGLRKPTKADVAASAKLADYLSEIDIGTQNFR